MPQKTDAVIAELMDRRLLNDVDPDLHQEIAKAVVKAVHTASLQGEDAVERVARLIFFAANDGIEYDTPTNDSLWYAWKDDPSSVEYWQAARAILATGLVPDEAAIRADEREKCAADKACLDFFEKNPEAA